MISDSELSELINVPKEWRSGDEKIYWPRAHDKFNLEWLETLWKYLCEYSKSDLTMMENFNIIFTSTTTALANNTTSSKSKHKSKEASTNDSSPLSSNAKNLILFKLSKNSNLVYTPPYQNDTTNISSNNSANETNGATTLTLTQTQTQTQPQSQNEIDKTSTKTTNTNSNASITEETYASLIRILNKLGFQCIDSISQTILSHALFLNYVPNLRINRFNLLRAFRNKYKHASTLKITQDFNALLNEADIKLLQLYLSKIEIISQSAELSSSTSNSVSSKTRSVPTAHELDEEKQLLEILKDLPIFENSSLECSVRYVPLKETSLIYDTPIRLPFELTGLKPFVFVCENETKLLIIEKLHLNLVKDFSVIIKEIIRYCTAKEFNTQPHKVHALGKWLLLNCASYLLANPSPDTSNSSAKSTTRNLELLECARNAKLFMNQNQELCAASQFINPLFKERFLTILDPKWIPAKDLVAEEKCINVLRELKMRNCLQLKVDEIIDLYEHSIKQNDAYRRLFSELVIDILVNRLQDVVNASSSATRYNIMA